MLDVFNFASPQTANYQEFYGGGTTSDWVKPRGASMVRMLLIGGGGGGGGASVFVGSGVGSGGGASGNVTQWIGPAIFIPDILRVTVGASGFGAPDGTAAGVTGGSSTIIYQAKDGTGYTLLTATGGLGGSSAGYGTAGGAAGTANPNNFFGAAGIYRSIGGQAGADRWGSVTADATIFLTGGAGGANIQNSSGSVTPAYGYPVINSGGQYNNPGNNGFFITQPIMMGAGGSGAGINSGSGPGFRGGNGGIGCGGGGSGGGTSGWILGGNGGAGAVFIWAW